MMEIFFKTWNQFQRGAGTFASNHLELQLIALGLLVDKGSKSYLFVNKELSPSKIVDNAIRKSVDEMLHLQPAQKYVQICASIRRIIEQNSSTGEQIIIYGYEMSLDTTILMHILSFYLVMPPDFIKKRITCCDLRSELDQLACDLPDGLFDDIEYPFGSFIQRDAISGKRSLEDKVKMLLSHEDCPWFDKTELAGTCVSLKGILAFIQKMKKEHGIN